MSCRRQRQGVVGEYQRQHHPSSRHYHQHFLELVKAYPEGVLMVCHLVVVQRRVEAQKASLQEGVQRVYLEEVHQACQGEVRHLVLVVGEYHYYLQLQRRQWPSYQHRYRNYL